MQDGEGYPAIFRYRVLLEVIGILIDIIGLDDILEIYRILLGKTPERVRRKATGPVRWQPVVSGDALPEGGAFMLFTSE